MSTSREAQAAATDDVRSRTSLLEVAQEAVAAYCGGSLRRAGAEYRGPCPIHEGKNPNLAVHDGKGLFRCYRCDAAGDVFAFVQAWRRTDFLGARAWLASRAGVLLPGDQVASYRPASRARGLPPVAPAPAPAPARVVEAGWSARSTADRARAAEEWRRRALAEGSAWNEPRAIYTLLRDALPLSDAARAYLAGRGLDPHAAFALGVRSIDDWSTVPALLDALGVDPWEAVAAGFDLAPAYTLPDGTTTTRPRRSTSPQLAAAGLPVLVFFYVGRGGCAVGARLRTWASREAIRAAGFDPGQLRYLSLRGNQPRLPWGADALAGLAGHDLHIAEGEPDGLTLRLYGLRSVALPGARIIPGLRKDAPTTTPWLRAAGRARRIFLWLDPDTTGDDAAPDVGQAVAAANGWTRAAAGRRILRVRPMLPDGTTPVAREAALASVDVNALHQTGRLRGWLVAAGLLAA